MKPGTIETTVKGIAFFGAAVGTQLASSLGQWANEDTWPSRINWVLIITLCWCAGCNAIISFMSGSYVRWKENGVDKTPKPPQVPTP